MKILLHAIILTGLLLSASGVVMAAMELPSIMGDNMLLQRGKAVVWGWDEPGSDVTVTFREKSFRGKAGEDGRFEIEIKTGAAGGAFELTIKGSDTVTLKNVLVGEVWVAGGQSNMWWAVGSCKNAKEEIAAADYPEIRFYDANTGPKEGGWRSDSPQRTVKTKWTEINPENVGGYPGTAFFFARDLYKKLGVPVGIVHVAVPGQKIETFMPKSACENVAVGKFDKPHKEDKQPATAVYWNGMIFPVAPYTTKGFIWWQGEANADRPREYAGLNVNLIAEWRRLWKNPAAPFLSVELHNFGPPAKGIASQDAPWPALRDAQFKVMKAVDNAWLVSVIDIKENPPVEADWQIHPARKQIAGERLFRAAMKVAYNDKDETGFGPIFKTATFAGGRATLEFDFAGAGLKLKNGDKLTGFSLAGKDGKFVTADGSIDKNIIILSSDKVAEPVAARYNWANHPVGNLVNSAEMPALAFRTDDWDLKMDK